MNSALSSLKTNLPCSNKLIPLSTSLQVAKQKQRTNLQGYSGQPYGNPNTELHSNPDRNLLIQTRTWITREGTIQTLANLSSTPMISKRWKRCVSFNSHAKFGNNILPGHCPLGCCAVARHHAWIQSDDLAHHHQTSRNAKP